MVFKGLIRTTDLREPFKRMPSCYLLHMHEVKCLNSHMQLPSWATVLSLVRSFIVFQTILMQSGKDPVRLSIYALFFAFNSFVFYK